MANLGMEVTPESWQEDEELDEMSVELLDAEVGSAHPTTFPHPTTPSSYHTLILPHRLTIPRPPPAPTHTRHRPQGSLACRPDRLEPSNPRVALPTCAPSALQGETVTLRDSTDFDLVLGCQGLRVTERRRALGMRSISIEP